MQPTPHNRPGRPIGISGIRVQAALHAKVAVDTLAEIARDEKAPADARVKAAETLLAHATAKRAA